MRGLNRIASLTAGLLAAAATFAADQRRPVVSDPAEEAFLKERTQLGGLSHASGTRPEFGPVARNVAIAEAAPVIRVGLSPTSFTSTGAVSAEYDTAAAHNHTAVETTGTGPYEVRDGAGAALGVFTSAQTLRATASGGAISVSVSGTPLGVVRGPLQLFPQEGSLLIVASMRRINRLAQGAPMTPAPYRGLIEIRVSETDPTRLRCINEVGIEEYVAGVVVNESLSSFHVEALKAQAVTARGYGLANRGRFASRGFDVDDSTLSQVYRGQSSETTLALNATLDTSTLVALRQGRILSALYSSSMGGHTENNEYVFPAAPGYPGANVDTALRGIHDSAGPQLWNLRDEGDVIAFYSRVDPDSSEVSPTTGVSITSLHRWTRTRSRDELLARLKDPARTWGVPASARTIRDIQTTIRGASGRAMQVVVTGDGWQSVISGWSDMRALATLAGQTPGGTTTTSAPNSPSALAIVRDAEGAVASVTFIGGGFGHNVGMSQYGAQGRALRGQSFVEILSAYYQGIEVAPAFSGPAALRAQGSLIGRLPDRRP